MSKYILYGAVVVLAVALVLTFGYESGYQSQPYQQWGGMMHQGGMGMGMGMHPAGGMGGLGFWNFGLLFWVLVAVFLYLLFKDGGREVRETPMDILNKRFARGEIDREEYDRIKKEILGGAQ